MNTFNFRGNVCPDAACWSAGYMNESLSMNYFSPTLETELWVEEDCTVKVDGDTFVNECDLFITLIL